MFAEELTKIKESEARADGIQKQAKKDSRKIVDDARAEAERILEEAENQAREIYDAMVSEGQRISDEQYEQFLTATKEECQAMAERARANQERAIELIAERIVRTSVNR